ncbi:hypothetical protein BH11ARM2_BH11ARM2_20520 [soil metagenome]
MIRIVGIQRSHFPQDEFVLLQNQGAIRLALRGHLLMTEEAIGRLSEKAAVHSFSDEAYIPAGAYVILKSGYGDPRWARTKDGALIYYAFAGREERLWPETSGPLHILNTQHSYVERVRSVAMASV